MTLIIRAPHAKNNNLFLVYQPLVSSKTNQMLGERGINTITDFALKRALMDWKTVMHKTYLHISVNLPPSYLVDKKCLEAFNFYQKNSRSCPRYN